MFSVIFSIILLTSLNTPIDGVWSIPTKIYKITMVEHGKGLLDAAVKLNINNRPMPFKGKIERVNGVIKFTLHSPEVKMRGCRFSFSIIASGIINKNIYNTESYLLYERKCGNNPPILGSDDISGKWKRIKDLGAKKLKEKTVGI